MKSVRCWDLIHENRILSSTRVRGARVVTWGARIQHCGRLTRTVTVEPVAGRGRARRVRGGISVGETAHRGVEVVDGEPRVTGAGGGVEGRWRNGAEWAFGVELGGILTCRRRYIE